MMYGKRENCSLQENGSLKGKTGYMEKRLIVHANINLRKRS